MGRRRGATGLAGMIVIDKPGGLTSHDVVAAVRRATGEGRVGHAGTLDPLATGVLVTLIGPYARLEKYLSGHDKGYSTTIAFGTETNTHDVEGAVVRTAAVPPEVFDPAYAQLVLAGFIGKSEQLPPAYSAIKVGGKTSHEVARAGGELVLQPRTITVHEATLMRVDAVAGTWDVEFLVSKGTYIRALARDIGRAVGSAAHLTCLRRTRAGSITIADAISLETIASRSEEASLTDLFFDAPTALGFPIVIADAQTADAVAHGRPLPLAIAPPDATLVSIMIDGVLRAVYRRESDRLAADTVLGIAL